MSRSNLIDLVVELKHETEKAYLVFDGAKTVWLPKSACELVPGHGTTYTLTLEETLALEKELL